MTIAVKRVLKFFENVHHAIYDGKMLIGYIYFEHGTSMQHFKCQRRILADLVKDGLVVRDASEDGLTVEYYLEKDN